MLQSAFPFACKVKIDRQGGKAMLEYIGGVKSYDLFINLGSVLGSILLIVLYYRKSGSWKETFAVFLLSLAIVQLGFFAGRLVRGLSYGKGRV